MNFFERQRQVRTASKRLVLLFVAAVLTITTMVNLAAIAASMSNGAAKAEQVIGMSVFISIGVLLMIGGVSLFKTWQLRRGGGVKVAESLGAIPVDDMRDPKLRRYRNIVEEISIASSTPVPVLYYLPNEPGINAFAAGYTPADAAVCVTQGALDRLNRDELMGVIAHEFSHIVNGDMRLSIKLIGVLAGITALSVIGRVMMSGSRRNNAAVLGLALLAIGWVGVFFGRLIKAAISRQREFLADASAVQFTRQTSGLAGALKKIGGLEAGSKLQNAKSENVSHMLFGEGFRFTSLLASMYATHPPLVKRIQALEPHFNAAELTQLRERWAYQPPNGLEEDVRLGFAQAPAAPPVSGQPQLDPREYAEAVGNPTAASYAAGVNIRNAIPQHLADRAHNPDTAVPLIYGMIFDPKEHIRRRQYDIVAAGHFGVPRADERRRAHRYLRILPWHTCFREPERGFDVGVAVAEQAAEPGRRAERRRVPDLRAGAGRQQRPAGGRARVRGRDLGGLPRRPDAVHRQPTGAGARAGVAGDRRSRGRGQAHPGAIGREDGDGRRSRHRRGVGVAAHRVRRAALPGAAGRVVGCRANPPVAERQWGLAKL